MRRSFVILGVIGLVLVGAACGTSRESAAPSVEEAAGDVAAGSTGSASGRDSSASGGGEAADAEAPEVVENILTPIAGPRVIQTAALSLTVAKDGFEDAVSRARTIANGVGGYVTSSAATQGGAGRLVRGSLELRVPQSAYGRVMSQLAELGRVRSQEESGQDVSGEFVDLQARRRHLEAVETQLLGFLERTRTVGEALAVQNRLNDVQLQLEEVRGRLAYLHNQTAFATITLQIAERGTPLAPPGGGWSIGDAWSAAAGGFLKVVGGVLVGLVVAGPIVVALALGYLAARTVLRRRRAHRETGSALG